MPIVTLLTETGNRQVDDILRGVIGIFEAAFPGRIRGYYLVGSHGDGSAVAASDIDMRIVFQGGFAEQEEEWARQIHRSCSLISPIPLDLNPRDETHLFSMELPDTKLGSTLIYGADIRDQIPLMPIDRYQHLLMHIPYRFLAQLRNHPPYLVFPLDYPDPSSEFYGYDNRDMRSADGKPAKGMKNLVMSIGVAAKAITALRAGVYIERKSEMVQRYQDYVNDEWTELVTAIYNKCNKQWEYFIPENEVERQELRELCQHALSFENHFLSVYRDFLLSELQSDMDIRTPFSIEQAAMVARFFGIELPTEMIAEYAGKASGSKNPTMPADPIYTFLAVKALGRVLYQDEEVMNVLDRISRSSKPYIQQAALQTMERIQRISETETRVPYDG